MVPENGNTASLGLRHRDSSHFSFSSKSDHEDGSDGPSISDCLLAGCDTPTKANADPSSESVGQRIQHDDIVLSAIDNEHKTCPGLCHPHCGSPDNDQPINLTTKDPRINFRTTFFQSRILFLHGIALQLSCCLQSHHGPLLPNLSRARAGCRPTFRVAKCFLFLLFFFTSGLPGIARPPSSASQPPSNLHSKPRRIRQLTISQQDRISVLKQHY